MSLHVVLFPSSPANKTPPPHSDVVPFKEVSHRCSHANSHDNGGSVSKNYGLTSTVFSRPNHGELAVAHIPHSAPPA
jgi:hypothetical protein